jgi:adenylate cyclase
VLFADVRGYTSITEGLAPLDVTALMNRFYETASAALLRHDALLGQVEGDNVMALFLPGFAGREYQRRAVDAGLSLLAAVGAGSDLGFEIGVGISTGEQFVGNVGGGGYKDFTALGDVTNTAARLTAEARAGELLIDAETFEQASERCSDADCLELELKGKSRPVTAYRIAAAGKDAGETPGGESRRKVAQKGDRQRR